jgi:membrane protein DedA with SNARE-associated domain
MTSVLDWCVWVMRTIGAPGVGVGTALETVFPPVPSEVVLPLAGYTASQGHYGVVAAVVWATAGSLLGALVLYYGAAAWGLERLCRVAERVPLLHARDVHRSIEWFQRHGRAAICRRGLHRRLRPARDRGDRLPRPEAAAKGAPNRDVRGLSRPR